MKIKDKYNQLLLESYPYKIELHAHTCNASSCGEISPQDTVRNYASLGYNAIAITNHFIDLGFLSSDKKTFLEVYLRDYYEAREEGEKQNINVILGAELRFHNENVNDYLIFGIEEDELSDIYDLMGGTFEEFCAQYKKDRHFLIQAHPFRNGIVLAKPEYLDGIEAYNMHPHHNSRVALAARYAKENSLIYTAGTDYHHEGHHGLSAMRFKTLPHDSFELAEELRENDFIMEIAGDIVL